MSGGFDGRACRSATQRLAGRDAQAHAYRVPYGGFSMSRRSRMALIISGVVLGLICILTITAVVVLRSAWFREQVRERIVADAEKATGGRVAIGSFDFEWSTMTARVNGFVIHGTEPAGSP